MPLPLVTRSQTPRSCRSSTARQFPGYTIAIRSKDAIHTPASYVTPTTCVDFTTQLDRKIEMLACHASQRDWLRAHHGMDEYIEAMKRYSAERGQQIGTAYAEAFVQHRGHPFPTTDLLTSIFQ